MNISDAQKEVRTVYLIAFSGLIVMSLIWSFTATARTWTSNVLAILVLVSGSTFIFRYLNCF